MVKNLKPNARSIEYWRKRTLDLEEALNKRGLDYYKELVKAYDKAIRETEREITKLYTKLASENNVSLSEAKKLLQGKELAEFKWTLEDYIKHAKESGVDNRWIRQLENASLKARISRLEAMQIAMRQQVELLLDTEGVELSKMLSDTYVEGYYRTTHMIQTGLGVSSAFTSLDTNRIEKVLSKPWIGNKVFSDRWGENKTSLIEELYKQLTQSVMRGESPDKAINTIAKRFNVSKRRAGTLIMTESAYFGNLAQQDSYKELDVEEQIFVATLDLKTSEICREMDGKILKTSDVEIGVNAPPLHCNCRSVLAPYFEGNVTERSARGKDGKTYYVDGSLTYEEWYKKYVEN